MIWTYKNYSAMYFLCLAWILVLDSCKFVSAKNGYIVPDPKIEALYPKGFRVSIEDSPGIRLFAFHGNINEEIPNLQAGTFSRDITRKRNGRWTFEDKTTRLEVGDVIHYWLFVIKDGLGYRSEENSFEIKELFDELQGQTITNESPSSQPNAGRPIDPPSVPSGVISRPSSNAESSFNGDMQNRLAICEGAVVSITQKLISMQSNLEQVSQENKELRMLYEKTPDARRLNLTGRFLPDQSPMESVRYVLRNTLRLNPDIISAQKNSENSITFEVISLEDKLEILRVAKTRLNSTSIFIN